MRIAEPTIFVFASRLFPSLGAVKITALLLGSHWQMRTEDCNFFYPSILTKLETSLRLGCLVGHKLFRDLTHSHLHSLENDLDVRILN
jgi:hypothetical protein